MHVKCLAICDVVLLEAHFISFNATQDLLYGFLEMWMHILI